MDSATRETVVIVVAAFLVFVLPALGVWLSTYRCRLRVGCLCLPLLILPGAFAINYYHVTYDDPREEAYAAAHANPDDLLDYDPIAGNLAVLIVSWVPPTITGLLTQLVLGIIRRSKARPADDKAGSSPPPV